LMVPASSGVGSLDALRAKAVADPGKLNYGTSIVLPRRALATSLPPLYGIATNFVFQCSPSHSQNASVVVRLPSVTKIGVGNLVSQLKDGKIKVLALTASHRWSQLPDIPTFAEAGLGTYPGGPI
jgi:tripartite-type tricarboxylate transporter receptor subunit TctC